MNLRDGLALDVQGATTAGTGVAATEVLMPIRPEMHEFYPSDCLEIEGLSPIVFI
jgi:hypothetical protein